MPYLHIFDGFNDAFLKAESVSQPTGKGSEFLHDRYLELSAFISVASVPRLEKESSMNNDHGLPIGGECKQQHNLILLTVSLSYSKVSQLKKGLLGSLS